MIRPRTEPRKIGKYVVEGVLGTGGMGIVYVAASSRGRVALKLIRDDVAADEDFRRRFSAEITAARSVDCPYVAAVLDADTEAERPWLATEYIEGQTLHDIVRANGPLDSKTLDVLAVGLAQALAALATAGVVHRDINPSNVLMAADRPVLIDFGIARLAGHTAMTTTGLTLGTPGYMAPEQLLGEDTSPATDIHGWASVVAYAATGTAPFAGPTVEATLYRVVHEEPQLFGVPDYLSELLFDALRKDPLSRPSAEEVLQGLLARTADAKDSSSDELTHRMATVWRQASFEHTRPLPVLASPAQRRRRRTVLAVTIAIAVAASFVVASVITLHRLRPRLSTAISAAPSSSVPGPAQTQPPVSAGVGTSPTNPPSTLAAEPPAITDAYSTDVLGERLYTEEGMLMFLSDETIYVYFLLTNPIPGTTVDVYVAGPTDGPPAGVEGRQVSYRFDPGELPGWHYLTFKPPNGRWQAGDYDVQISVDGVGLYSDTNTAPADVLFGFVDN